MEQIIIGMLDFISNFIFQYVQTINILDNVSFFPMLSFITSI